MSFENVKNTNAFIIKELEYARLPVIHNEKMIIGEVSTTISSNLNELKFTRAWTYWVVRGDVPMDIAKKIYSDPIGKDDVRAFGHCGNVDPAEYGTRRECVDVYHIDSIAGFRLFVDILTDYKGAV